MIIILFLVLNDNNSVFSGMLLYKYIPSFKYEIICHNIFIHEL
jgi:hypothetical protein